MNGEQSLSFRVNKGFSLRLNTFDLYFILKGDSTTMTEWNVLCVYIEIEQQVEVFFIPLK